MTINKKFIMYVLICELLINETISENYNGNVSCAENNTDRNEENFCHKENFKYEDLTEESHCFQFLLEQNYHPQHNPTQSSSIKHTTTPNHDCAACIAVAKMLNDVSLNHFKVVQKNGKSGYPNLKLECVCGFETYALQEWNGQIYIGPSKPYSEHTTILEVLPWPEVLEDMCMIFVNMYGEMNLYDEWVSNSRNLTDLLCRGEGVFASCKFGDEGQNSKQDQLPDEYPKCIR